MDMKIIEHEDIIKLNISKQQCFSWVQEALNMKQNSYLPPKCSVKPEKDIFFTSMPCLLPDLDVYGLKMVSRIPTQKPALNSTMMLFRYSTGELLTVMDCNWITAMRTGAVATLSILKLAKQNFTTIGCVGLGNTCESTLDILFSICPQRRMKILLKKYKDHAQRIIERYKHYDNLSFEVVETMEELISTSDVVLSCITSTSENLGEDSWFKEGCTIIPIHTMGFQNCDLFFDKIVIDDYEHVKKFKYFNQFKEVIELKDTLAVDTIRDNDQQRIMAYNVGIALHDVYFATKIYELSNIENASVHLNEIKDKYWV